MSMNNSKTKCFKIIMKYFKNNKNFTKKKRYKNKKMKEKKEKL